MELPARQLPGRAERSGKMGRMLARFALAALLPPAILCLVGFS